MSDRLTFRKDAENFAVLVPLLRSQPVTLKKVFRKWGTFFMSSDLSGFQNLTGLVVEGLPTYFALYFSYF